MENITNKFIFYIHLGILYLDATWEELVSVLSVLYSQF